MTSEIAISNEWQATRKCGFQGEIYLELSPLYSKVRPTLRIQMSSESAMRLLLCISGWRAWDTLGAVGGWKNGGGRHIIATDGVIRITRRFSHRVHRLIRWVDMNRLGEVLI